jgi:hypothetical protein
VFPGTVIDTSLVADVDPRIVDGLVCADREARQPEADAVREAYIEERVEKEAQHYGGDREKAREAIRRHIEDKKLPPIVVLPMDDRELAGSTVADVLKNPSAFDRRTLADPFEPGEGKNHAIIFLRPNGNVPFITSRLHGGYNIELVYSEDPTEDAAVRVRKREQAEGFAGDEDEEAYTTTGRSFDLPNGYEFNDKGLFKIFKDKDDPNKTTRFKLAGPFDILGNADDGSGDQHAIVH